MSLESRRRALETARLLHPNPDAIRAPLFHADNPFFLAADKVQVKYEMLRARDRDGLRVNRAAELFGYSRPAFYLIMAAFEERGMLGLLDEPRGRRGPLKLSPAILEFVRGASADLSGARLALEIQERFGVSLHRRTVERLR